MDQRRSDTRDRIRSVALELFAEKGYGNTSLREIADRLGVTKAALYYHFKTKEDIVADIAAGYLVELDSIIEWGSAQPRTPATWRELVRRYADLVHGRGGELMRFAHDNQSAVRELAVGEQMRDRFKRVIGLLTDPDAPVADQLRKRMALVAIHSGRFMSNGLDAPPEEIEKVSLELALGLLPG